MNKLVFAHLLGLLLSACQNTPKNASENTATAPAAAAEPAPPSPEGMQEATAKLTTGVKMMEDLRKQVDALPDKVKKEKAAEIAGYYSSLEGMIEKQTGMLNEIKAASPAPSGAATTQESVVPSSLNAAQLQDYNESAARYAQEAQAMQEALGKLAASTKKGQ